MYAARLLFLVLVAGLLHVNRAAPQLFYKQGGNVLANANAGVSLGFLNPTVQVPNHPTAFTTGNAGGYVPVQLVGTHPGTVVTNPNTGVQYVPGQGPSAVVTADAYANAYANAGAQVKPAQVLPGQGGYHNQQPVQPQHQQFGVLQAGQSQVNKQSSSMSQQQSSSSYSESSSQQESQQFLGGQYGVNQALTYPSNFNNPSPV